MIAAGRSPAAARCNVWIYIARLKCVRQIASRWASGLDVRLLCAVEQLRQDDEGVEVVVGGRGEVGEALRRPVEIATRVVSNRFESNYAIFY